MDRNETNRERFARIVSGLRESDNHLTREGWDVTLRLDGFAAEAVDEEADRLGISVDELVSFSVLYYLADIDSGRISRQIVGRPHHNAGGEPE